MTDRRGSLTVGATKYVIETSRNGQTYYFPKGSNSGDLLWVGRLDKERGTMTFYNESRDEVVAQLPDVHADARLDPGSSFLRLPKPPSRLKDAAAPDGGPVGPLGPMQRNLSVSYCSSVGVDPVPHPPSQRNLSVSYCSSVGLSFSNSFQAPGEAFAIHAPEVRFQLGTPKTVRVSGTSPSPSEGPPMPPAISIDSLDDDQEEDDFPELPSWMTRMRPRRASEGHCPPELVCGDKEYLVTSRTGSLLSMLPFHTGLEKTDSDSGALVGPVVPFPFRAHPLLAMAMPGPVAPKPAASPSLESSVPTATEESFQPLLSLEPETQLTVEPPSVSSSSSAHGSMRRLTSQSSVKLTETTVDPPTASAARSLGRRESRDRSAALAAEFDTVRPETTGAMIYPAGRYEGRWSFDQPEGEGTLQYHDLTYSGEFRAGLTAGDGALYFPSGDRCDGKWSGDTEGQKGRMAYANGDVYEWVWGAVLGTGSATLTFGSGDRLEGAVANYMWNGPGRFMSSSGFSYVGEYKDGMMWGQGRLAFRNGSTYEGEFRTNEFDGYGVYVDALNHNVYQGRWLAGRMHGDGILTFASGDQWVGTWAHDKKTTGSHVFKSNV